MTRKNLISGSIFGIIGIIIAWIFKLDIHSMVVGGLLGICQDLFNRKIGNTEETIKF